METSADMTYVVTWPVHWPSENAAFKSRLYFEMPKEKKTVWLIETQIKSEDKCNSRLFFFAALQPAKWPQMSCHFISVFVGFVFFFFDKIFSKCDFFFSRSLSRLGPGFMAALSSALRLCCRYFQALCGDVLLDILWQSLRTVWYFCFSYLATVTR